MKKFRIVLLVVLLNLSLFCISAYADIGPKPSIKIIAKNMPDEICYMDLLINYSDNSYMFIDDLSKYDENMLKTLKEYSVEGWRPALVTGTRVPIFGDIICDVQNGKSEMNYGYLGVPDYFKIIVVTKSNQVIVSNAIDRKAFQSTVYFDFESGNAYEKSLVLSYIFQFFKTFIPTILIELLILLIFRFNIRKNLKPFILINLFTQALLTLVVIGYTLFKGTLSALFAYVLFEIVIIIIESILFSKYLSGYNKLRKVLYAIVANIVSFIIGVMILLYI